MPNASESQLVDQARSFAADVSELLNNTVTNGVRVSAVLDHRGTCWAAPGITKTDLTAVKAVPLRQGRKAAPGYLMVAFVLQLDAEGEHLTVAKSQYGLYVDEDLQEMALHYDYDREPGNVYPLAHVQMSGQCDALDAIGQRAGVVKEVKDYHLPVGGKRFRPSLEDLVEFLIVEGIAEGADGWEGVVREHRATWERVQLMAAVRRNERAAAEQLEAMGWKVSPPRG